MIYLLYSFCGTWGDPPYSDKYEDDDPFYDEIEADDARMEARIAEREALKEQQDEGE